jgi:hypothetical protein
LLVVWYESFANEAVIDPVGRTLFEIDCPQHMSRILSSSVKTNGTWSTSGAPTQWDHLAPESGGDNLRRVACSN